MNINKDNAIELIQGKTVEFVDVRMSFNKNKTDLIANIISNDLFFLLECNNITYIKLEAHSQIFVVNGFEILDKRTCGWQKENRYYIHDFEDGLLNIYCEDISISLIK